MSEKTPNEHEKWRKFLTPLVGGILAVLSTVSMALGQMNKHDSDAKNLSMDARMAVVETKVEGINDMRLEIRELTKSVNQLIGTVDAQMRFRK